jgi:hypothetical protein
MTTEQEPPTIPVKATELQPGDVFQRHGKTWTVKHAGTWGPYGSVYVDAVEGRVYMSKALDLDVRRPTGESACTA